MYCFRKGLFLEGIVGGWVWLGGVIVSLRKVGGCWVDVRMIERVLRFVE